MHDPAADVTGRGRVGNPCSSAVLAPAGSAAKGRYEGCLSGPQHDPAGSVACAAVGNPCKMKPRTLAMA